MVYSSTCTLDSISNFGKYKGKTFREVLEEDADYIFWALKEVDFFYLYKKDFDFVMGYIVKCNTHLGVAQFSFAKKFEKSISEEEYTEMWYSVCLELHFINSPYDYYSIKHKLVPNRIHDSSKILFEFGDTDITENDIDNILILIEEIRDNCKHFIYRNTVNGRLLYEETMRFASLVQSNIMQKNNITTAIVYCRTIITLNHTHKNSNSIDDTFSSFKLAKDKNKSAARLIISIFTRNVPTFTLD